MQTYQYLSRGRVASAAGWDAAFFYAILHSAYCFNTDHTDIIPPMMLRCKLTRQAELGLSTIESGNPYLTCIIIALLGIDVPSLNVVS